MNKTGSRLSVALLVLVVCAGPSVGQELERWDRAVCLVTEAPSTEGKPGFKWGTGFFVNREQTLYLVTARHVAQDTNSATKLLYRKSDGESRWLVLSACLEPAGDPWHNHAVADLSWCAIAKESKLDQENRRALHELAIDWESLAEATPHRTSPIEIVGFPFALGTTPEVSPLAMSGTIASKELATKSAWGIEPAVYALPAVGSGCSGGPVFAADDDPQATRIVAMYIGIAFDESGAKLSKLVPANLIRSALAEAKEAAASAQ